jgi:hypothetical protein
MKSFDPRINRIDLPLSEEKKETLKGHEHWETYEVFHQKKRGDQHVHVGIVHAPSPEIALVFAKKQYGRKAHVFLQANMMTRIFFRPRPRRLTARQAIIMLWIESVNTKKNTVYRIEKN